MDPRPSTLAGVLTRLREGHRSDPAVEQRLNEVFGRYEGRVLSLCRRELRGFTEAQIEEVAQDVLLEGWRRIMDYDSDRARFLAFLTGITRMKCANARRRARYLFWDDLFADEPVAPGPDALQQLTDGERDQLIQASAEAVLEVREREVVHLRWILDYSYEDVAARLGMANAEEVRVVLQRCLRRMGREVERRLAERGHGASFLRA